MKIVTFIISIGHLCLLYDMAARCDCGQLCCRRSGLRSSISWFFPYL